VAKKNKKPAELFASAGLKLVFAANSAYTPAVAPCAWWWWWWRCVSM